MRADVIVVGLGVMGSAALWRLARRGANVVGFDQYDPPHSYGSSHGESRIIRTAYYQAPQYVPLVQDAFELWRQLERETAQKLMFMTGALTIGDRSGPLVGAVRRSVLEHALPHEVLDVQIMRSRYPQHHLDDGDIGIYDPGGGYLLAESAVSAMLGRAKALDAQVFTGTRVNDISVDADRVSVTVGDTTHHARHIIIAVGPWIQTFLSALGLPLSVERQVLVWFAIEQPELYVPHRFPVFIREVAGNRIRYGFPSLDGQCIKLAVHHEGKQAEPADVDREVNEEDLVPLRGFIQSYLPGVDKHVLRAEVCLFTNAPNEDFLIGAPDGMSGLTILSPCSGHGFKFAPIIGDIAADLSLTGTTAYPTDPFAMSRHATGRG